MRRRPMEFWWIAAFCFTTALWCFSHPWKNLNAFDRPMLLGYGAGLIFSAILLMCFSRAGRWICFALLGVAAIDQFWLMLSGMWKHAESAPFSVVFLCFALWMLFYLQRPSTARLFLAGAGAPRVRTPFYGFHLIDLLEVLFAATVGKLALLAGAPLWAAGGIALACYIIYGLFMEDWVRQHWAAFFARLEPGFPPADATHWRAACNALSRKETYSAQQHMAAASDEARQHPAGRLFLQMLAWHELVEQKPNDGRAALRRAAFDQDWKPINSDRKRMADYVESVEFAALRELVDERAALIEGLIQAGLNSGSFFYNRADRILTRITGEAYAFNTHESWATWWEEVQADWSGDMGLVSLSARLLHGDACAAAHGVALLASPRAEEPLLKEVTAQVLFLNAMQKAIREHGDLQAFIKQPQRMLLVPELTDNVGLLHADSMVLEEMGMQLSQVARRLQLRVPLIDYLSRLWCRYPSDLNADMPWLIPTLTGRNFGILRARSKFEAWWPDARESLLRHDKAVAAGLTAMARGDDARAEECFRAALKEQSRELSARYNLAICLARRKAHHEAAELLEQLTKLEPKEPYWWMVLGDIHRTVNKSTEAYKAFRRALELGAAEGRVAWHMGLTFARDKRDAEAIQQLDRALGKNPSTSKIEALVSALESEGLWGLAGHYREEAFRRGLNPDSDGHDEREGGDMIG